jgi:TfoX/Sxy family transcriptional regulator of competence genes
VPASRPSFEKSPPELIARFEVVAARFPEAERRKMFGYPALFVGGNLATGLFADSWMIRLPDDARGELLKLPGARDFEVMPGRVMGGYAVLPPDVVGDDARIDAWVRRAVEHAASLPPKR